MSLSVQFSLIHSDLNKFLFAPVGIEQNGMSLSVISALTRLDIDPWEEALRLANLPRALAIDALEQTIARLPIDRTQPPLDNLAITRRLLDLLPARGQATTPGRAKADAKSTTCLQAVILLACLGLGAAMLFTML
jgi:hypothetical protein